MSNRPRVLVLVLSIDRDPWRTIERQGQRQTWASSDPLDEQVPVRFYYGRAGPVAWTTRLADKAVRTTGLHTARPRVLATASRGGHQRPAAQHDDRIYTTVPDTWIGITSKTQAALRHVLAHEDFDFVLRTNTSTYVNRSRLAAVVSELPTSGYYGGYLIRASTFTFAAGTGILMSRDVAQLVADAEDLVLTGLDDREIGRSLAKRRIRSHQMHRLDLAAVSDVSQYAERLRGEWHIRCKCESDRSRDIDVMHAVHRFFADAT